MEPEKPEKPSNLIRGWLWFTGIPSKLQAKLHEVSSQSVKITKEDPRRLIHSLKVGLAVTLVSLLYYFQPLYGVSTMWAVMTVIVVFEFSVGATIGKGLNRGLATLAAAALGLGAHHLANLTGESNEPYLIGLFVFIQAAAMTFIRFFPKVKAKYDYGMLIFILTFCLISISGFRTNEVLKLAQERLVTILIGASTCLAVCILICPVWAGEDLHKLVAHNLSHLGNFLEEHKTSNDALIEKARSSTINLNSILFDSKSREEALANVAVWEPGHGQFMYRHPWKQYLKIGKLTRQCACRLEALNGYLNSKFQVYLKHFSPSVTLIARDSIESFTIPSQKLTTTYSQPQLQLQAPPEIQRTIQEGFSELGKTLREVAWEVETMAKPSSPNPHIANLKIESNKLKSLLKSSLFGDRIDIILHIIPVAVLMIDTVSYVEQIADAVSELSFMADFKIRSRNRDEGESEIGNDNKCMSIGMAEIPSVCITIAGGDGVAFGTESSAEAGDQILV